MKPTDLKHQNLQKTLLKHYESRASDFSGRFLKWFLENILRLDSIEADDACVDAKHDKGIDAIYVDDVSESIFVIQSKTKTNENATLGDADLKSFVGALKQFESHESVTSITQETKNERLRQAIIRNSVVEKIKSGYGISGLFITNVKANKDANDYLKKIEGIELYDSMRISGEYVDLETDGGISESFKFDTSDSDVISYDAGGASARIFLAPALNLLRMSGISDGRLFEQNVRLSLGNTKVNKSLRESIRTKSEHCNFPLYHNGINVLCRKIDSETDQAISVSDYVVVNGAQSLSSLLAERSKISDDLKILVKLIEVKGNVALSQKITRNSNNQNAIKARDLKSNNNIQQRLKIEVEKVSKGGIAFEIKQGEKNKGKIVISNENAGLILLAIDLEQPWSCHQKYKVMDDLHSDIFGRPSVTGARVIALWSAFQAIGDSLSEIDNRAFAQYTLTRYLLAYAVARIIKEDSVGASTMARLDEVVANGRLPKFVESFKELAVAVANDLNAEIACDEEEQFNYKSDLKSAKWTKAIAARLVSQYKKDVSRRKADPINKVFREMCG